MLKWNKQNFPKMLNHVHVDRKLFRYEIWGSLIPIPVHNLRGWDIHREIDLEYPRPHVYCRTWSQRHVELTERVWLHPGDVSDPPEIQTPEIVECLCWEFPLQEWPPLKMMRNHPELHLEFRRNLYFLFKMHVLCASIFGHHVTNKCQ